jgi:hypothetical protein
LHRFPEYKQEEQNMKHPLKSLLKLNLFALVAITAAVTPQALNADDQSPQILMNPNVVPRNGVLHVTKLCNQFSTAYPGSYCTIASSNLLAIPANSTVFYFQAAIGVGTPTPIPDFPLLSLLDSNIVLYVGTGNWAVGRCTLDNNTNLGVCTFSDGTGPLTGFTARLNVSPDSTNPWLYHWDGTYSFSSEPPK